MNEKSSVTLGDHPLAKYNQTPSAISKITPRRVGTQGIVSPSSNQKIYDDSKKSKKKTAMSEAPSRVFKVDQELFVFEDN